MILALIAARFCGVPTRQYIYSSTVLKYNFEVNVLFSATLYRYLIWFRGKKTVLFSPLHLFENFSY